MSGDRREELRSAVSSATAGWTVAAVMSAVAAVTWLGYDERSKVGAVMAFGISALMYAVPAVVRHRQWRRLAGEETEDPDDGLG